LNSDAARAETWCKGSLQHTENFEKTDEAVALSRRFAEVMTNGGHLLRVYLPDSFSSSLYLSYIGVKNLLIKFQLLINKSWLTTTDRATRCITPVVIVLYTKLNAIA